MEMRTSKPQAGNKYYIRQVSGGWNGAVQGKPTDACNVLANCVGYANGRFNEIGAYGECKYQLVSNAENFIEHAKKQGLQVVDYPTLGGIMVFQKGETLNGSDGAGHVMIVERIDNANQIYTSESGYGSNAFWNSLRTNNNGRWGMGKGYTFRGCIVNPAIGPVIGEDPKPEPIPEPPKPEPTPIIENTIKEGDIVTVNGAGNANSYGTSRSWTGKYNNRKMKVIMIAKGRPYPYACNQYGEGKVGNASSVTGWFSESSVTK